MTTTTHEQGPPDERSRLEVVAESITETEDGLELTVKLRNPLDRAVHYISDVRAMVFDSATRRLRVQLSDQGRETPPGGITMQPRLRMIDPQSEAVATVRLPRTIVKLAENPSPTGDVLFEEHVVSEATEIELEIGWADSPYYTDPREKPPGAASAVSEWEQDTARAIFVARTAD